MKTTLLAVSISSCLFFACSNSSDSSTTESAMASDSSVQNTVPFGADAAVQAPPADNSQMTATPGVPPSGQAAQPQPVTTTAPGMNPPHGEPGHRCEIAVGAPLNSSPATATPTQVSTPVLTTPSQTSPTITPSIPAPATSTPPAPTTTAPGMNPPHGQPGHDCNIAVGAPLKK